MKRSGQIIAPSMIGVAVSFVFVPVRVIAGPSPHLCMECNEFRYKSTIAKWNI